MTTVAMPETPAPLQVIEQIATANKWPLDRVGDNQVNLFIAGRWSEYEVAFSWLPDLQVLHMACGFSLAVPANQLEELRTLLRLLNEMVWVGHFDNWPQADMVLFRHAALCPEGEGLSAQQGCEMLLRGLETCEDYFAAFGFVVRECKDAQEALQMNITDTKGTA